MPDTSSPLAGSVLIDDLSYPLHQRIHQMPHLLRPVNDGGPIPEYPYQPTAADDGQSTGHCHSLDVRAFTEPFARADGAIAVEAVLG
ncbi:hypothetical protein ACFLWA_09650 [Chloroflexota bacterium]